MRILTKNTLGIVIVHIVLFVTAAGVHAQDTDAASPASSSRWWAGEYATGDWGGIRSKLADAGVHFSLSYEEDFAANVTGGRSQGAASSGNIEASFLFDLQKLWGLNNSSFFVRFIDRNGSCLSADRADNFFPIQQDYGVPTFVIQALAFEKKFPLSNDGVLSVKLGRFAATGDFAGSPLYGLYMNNAIDGAPKGLFTSGAFSSYPGAVWAARFSYTAPQNRWYAKTGVYQANDRMYSGAKHGFEWDIRRNDGVTVISEIGYNPRRNDTPDGKPGHFWAGGYVSFWDIPRIDGKGVEDTSYAFYLHADQMIWRGAAQTNAPSVTTWAVATFAPVEAVQVMPWQVSAGLVWTGAIPARPRDEVVLGVSVGHFSDDYRAQNTALYPNDGENTGESMAELGYRIKLNRFCTLQPGVQYIMDPSGFANRDNLLVLTMRLNLIF